MVRLLVCRPVVEEVLTVVIFNRLLFLHTGPKRLLILVLSSTEALVVLFGASLVGGDGIAATAHPVEISHNGRLRAAVLKSFGKLIVFIDKLADLRLDQTVLIVKHLDVGFECL